MQLPVTLRPRSSRALGAALVLAHGLAALGLALTGLALALKLLSGFVLALSLVVALRRPSVSALTLKADGCVVIERQDGAQSEVRIHPDTTVFPWLVVLLLKAEGRIIRLTLPLDALDAEGHRQLRLWLRWQAKP